MKFGLLGDLQFTNRGPIRRKDNYFVTLLDKLAQAMKIFVENDCERILQVGDFCDSPTVANRVKAEIIYTLLRYYKKLLPILCVFGQHDISGHSKLTLPNSPLAVLEAAGVVKILGIERNPGHFCVYGASFGEEIPKVEFKEDFNILVVHDMIGNRPLYPGQPLESPRVFLRKHPEYNLVCCGDYHYPFHDKYQGRLILNPGALVRKNITDVRMGLQPSVVIVDSDDLSFQIFPLKVEPTEKVFDLTKKEDKKGSQILNQFIEKLNKAESSGISWKNILSDVLKERKTSEEVKILIDEVLEKVENDKEKILQKTIGLV